MFMSLIFVHDTIWNTFLSLFSLSILHQEEGNIEQKERKIEGRRSLKEEETISNLSQDDRETRVMNVNIFSSCVFWDIKSVCNNHIKMEGEREKREEKKRELKNPKNSLLKK